MYQGRIQEFEKGRGIGACANSHLVNHTHFFSTTFESHGSGLYSSKSLCRDEQDNYRRAGNEWYMDARSSAQAKCIGSMGKAKVGVNGTLGTHLYPLLCTSGYFIHV